jgi:hypothetical protein
MRKNNSTFFPWYLLGIRYHGKMVKKRGQGLHFLKHPPPADAK